MNSYVSGETKIYYWFVCVFVLWDLFLIFAVDSGYFVFLFCFVINSRYTNSCVGRHIPQQESEALER